MSFLKPLVIQQMDPEREAWFASLPQPLFGPTSFLDYVDRSFDSELHLTKDQGDYLCRNATDEELDLLTTPDKTFTQKRQTVQIINKYKQLFTDSQ